MFLEFFYLLRSHGLGVTLHEWMTLMEALSKGLAAESSERFYRLARSICVKDEADFDTYDRCFAEFFRGQEPTLERIAREVMDWLEDPILPRELSPQERARLEALDLDELRRQLAERLREQDERHDGGNRWVGTGGTSPFGHSGTNPAGIRIGGGGGGRTAVQIASQRRFRNLRSDRVLDVRDIGVALRQLRRLSRIGAQDELDLEETVARSARNAGDITLAFKAPRRNTVKLLLLMDVGGSMTPHSILCERLFSAAYQAKHFKTFRHYFFHNCPYEKLYTDIWLGEGLPTQRVLKDLDASWLVMLVGDAAMAPSELSHVGGAIDYFHHNSHTGLWWLERIRERFPRSVWLNPDPPAYWEIPSTRMIRRVYEMFPLTMDGLKEATDTLRRKADPRLG